MNLEQIKERYEIRRDGTVFSKRMNKPLKGHCLNGYKRVRLKYNGGYKNFYVHRLVAECYVENPLSKKQVNHKDGNKGNNCVENLEWNTSKENINHAWNNLGLKMPKGFDSPNSKMSPSQVEIMRSMRTDGCTYAYISNKFGFSKSAVWSAVNTRYK